MRCLFQFFLFGVFYLNYGLQQMGCATSSYCRLKTWNSESLWCNCNILWKKLCILCFVFVVNAVPKRRWQTKMNFGFIQIFFWLGHDLGRGLNGAGGASLGPEKKTWLIIGPNPCRGSKPMGGVRECKNPARTRPVVIPIHNTLGFTHW